MKKGGSLAPRAKAEATPPPPIVDESKPYPDTGPLAVAARVALIGCVAILIYATFAPGDVVPRLLYSNNLEHFAAFYIAALVAAAAFPRRRLRWLTLAFAVFALALEGSRTLQSPGIDLIERWNADFGGVMAAYVPMVIQRFRRLFPRAGT